MAMWSELPDANQGDPLAYTEAWENRVQPFTVGDRVEMPVSDTEWQTGTVKTVEHNGAAVTVAWDDEHESTEPDSNLEPL